MNKIDKELRKLAKSLPKLYTTVKVTRLVTGEQLIKAGVETTKAGEFIKPSSKYSFPMDEKQELNHYKELKKHYDKGGLALVKKYCEVVNRKANKNKPTPE